MLHKLFKVTRSHYLLCKNYDDTLTFLIPSVNVLLRAFNSMRFTYRNNIVPRNNQTLEKFSYTFCLRLNLYHRPGVIENNCMNFYIGSINKNADSVNNNSHFFLIHYFWVKSLNLKLSVGIYIRITRKKRIKQAMRPVASYVIINLF